MATGTDGELEVTHGRSADEVASRDAVEQELAELWNRWHTSRDVLARNRLVEIYYPLTLLVARKLASTLSDEISFEDIRGYAAEGLLDAIDRFNPVHGVKFSTFAPYRMRGTVYDRIREFDWVSRTDRQRERELRQIRDDFVRQHHRQPTREEEARLVGSTQASHEGLVARLASSKMTSLEAGHGVDGLEFDSIARDGGPLAVLLSGERSSELQAALLGLNDREREVIVLTYVHERSLSEVGKVLGVTESRVCQIRARALRLLRRTLASSGITEAREEVIA